MIAPLGLPVVLEAGRSRALPDAVGLPFPGRFISSKRLQVAGLDVRGLQCQKAPKVCSPWIQAFARLAQGGGEAAMAVDLIWGRVLYFAIACSEGKVHCGFSRDPRCCHGLLLVRVTAECHVAMQPDSRHCPCFATHCRGWPGHRWPSQHFRRLLCIIASLCEFVQAV